MASGFKQEVATKSKLKTASGKQRTQRPALPKAEESLFDWDKISMRSGEKFWGKTHSAKVSAFEGDRVFVVITDSEATAPNRKFFLLSSELVAAATIGMELAVYVSDNSGKDDDLVQVSMTEAALLQQFSVLSNAFQAKEMLAGEVLGKVKGGYNVSLWLTSSKDDSDHDMVAVRAFLPATLASADRQSSGALQYHKQMWFTVKELNNDNGSIVVSLRRFLRKEKARLEQECLDNLQVGDTVKGIVKRIVAYGAFVDIGGVDAFLHVSDFSWDKHVDSSYLRVNQKIIAQVIEASPTEKKIKISIKALSIDPWEQAVRDFAPGSDIQGTVVSIADFGVFVQLREGIEGLVHVSEISWGRIKHPSTKLAIGDEVKVRVIDLDPKQRKISLSLKALQPNPLEQYLRDMPKDVAVEASIMEVSSFGIVLHLEEGVIGFVPKSEISWHDMPETHYSEGQLVRVVLLKDALERNRILCSIKRTSEDPWLKWNEQYKIGSQHDFKITRVTESGVEFQPEPGLHAWCPKTELEEGSARRPAELVKLGQVLRCQVIKRETRNASLTVSPRAALRADTDKSYHEYIQKQQKQGVTATTSLGEAFSKHRE